MKPSPFFSAFAFRLVALFSLLLSSYKQLFAEDAESGIFGRKGVDDIKNGDFTLSDIPGIINYATEFFLAFSGTISVLVIIAGAIKMQLSSFSDGKSQGQKIVTAGIIGFVISASAWFIINVIITNL